MANDSLSGVVLTAFLARYISNLTDRYWSYRIVFVPETIGAIAYCAANEKFLKDVDLGLVITTVGGPGQYSYKQTKQQGHWLERHRRKGIKKRLMLPIRFSHLTRMAVTNANTHLV